MTLCLLPLLPNFVQFCILRKCFAVSCSVASLCACGEDHDDMARKGVLLIIHVTNELHMLELKTSSAEQQPQDYANAKKLLTRY